MKILFINQAFYPDVVSTSQHLFDICVRLSEAGHSVTVLSGQRGYAAPHPLYEKKENYRGINIVRTWPLGLSRLQKKARVLEAFFVNAAFAWRLCWMGRFDKIVAMTSPPMLAWFASLYAKLFKIKFTYWVMDVNPDEIIEAGWVSKDAMSARILESALRSSLKASDQIIVLDKYMKERIGRRPVELSKISICPPWPHDDDLKTESIIENKFINKYSLQNKFIMMYSGNHSICHPLDTILGAAKILKSESSFVFIFIGGGERVSDVRRFKEKHELNNILQLPYQPRNELGDSLSAANLHFVVMGDPFTGVVHPCKTYGILRVGKPFVYIGPKRSHIQDMIHESGLGKRISHGESEELADYLREMSFLSEKKQAEIQKKSKEYLDSKFSAPILLKKMEDILCDYD